METQNMESQIIETEAVPSIPPIPPVPEDPAQEPAPLMSEYPKAPVTPNFWREDTVLSSEAVREIKVLRVRDIQVRGLVIRLECVFSFDHRTYFFIKSPTFTKSIPERGLLPLRFRLKRALIQVANCENMVIFGIK